MFKAVREMVNKNEPATMLVKQRWYMSIRTITRVRVSLFLKEALSFLQTEIITPFSE